MAAVVAWLYGFVEKGQNLLVEIWRQIFVTQNPSLHYKAKAEAKTAAYGKYNVLRIVVANELLDWSISYPDYNPVYFTAPGVLKDSKGVKPIWADDEPINWTLTPNWNAIDEINGHKVNRISYEKTYDFETTEGDQRVPLNPRGRRGIRGRGELGRWGPNHAADPIVTRWADREKRILEFVAIQRRDTGEWAIPGGMVDAGEVISETLKREFCEEALASLEVSDEERKQLKEKIDELFANGEEIYKGYVDDPRNTDNAWMETEAYNFHDEEGSSFSKIELKAGDDAKHVQWMPITSDIKLYASHSDFVRKVAQRHNANL
ncbi:DgyrCDS9507 [Dimorphilus gyrociliatus]|uniref:DgyrCDS9507 n=1 Tax=Dimorphilus gyrociliatus TaxID=2664684 RepID=A0A7I8VX73_9ANNE|nr:DgyrCDS9507 [Dimorphilus gyrociliatus]